jgi:lipopolysaccharide export system protein LptA
VPRRAAGARGVLALVSLAGGALPGCGARELDPLPDVATAEGVRLEAEVGAARYRIALAGAEADLVAGGPVSATATEVERQSASPGADLDIVAARSSWDLRGRSAHFEGDVRVTRGPVTLRCAALDVTYAGAETLDTVVATGGVTVTRGERRASAERAELVGKTGRITLTGRPGVNTLVGERIILWLDDERADCEGGVSGPCRLVVAARAIGG